MTTTLDNAYQSVGTITSDLIAKPSNHKKSISAIISVIELTTNDKSVDETKKLLKYLVEIQDTLPASSADYNLAKCKEHFDFVNEHLTEINSFLDFIKLLFDHGNAVDIDNDNMLAFLANMQKAQQVLSYISDYLTLVMKTQKNKQEAAKEYTADTLIEYLAA